MSDEKINSKWNESLKPRLEGYIKSLLKGLEDENIIISDDSAGVASYRLSNRKSNVENPSVTTTTTVAPTTITNILIRSLTDLRNITRSIFLSLNYIKTVNVSELPLSKMLRELEDQNAFSVKWKNKNELLKMLDILDDLSNDLTSEKAIERQLNENNFNPNIIISDLLEYFGKQKIYDHFEYNPLNELTRSKDDGVDWLVLNHNIGNLYFNFKLRRNDPLPEKEALFQAIKQFDNARQAAYSFLIVFTYENTGAFEKLKFQLRQIFVNDLPEFSSYTDRIKFIPISIGDIGLLDQEFASFKRTYIADELEFVFKSQPAPRGFSDRNDHFFERVFNFRTTEFKIQIEPITAKFWRFGFQFTQDESFPSLAQERHKNKDVGDIHICVGDLDTTVSNNPLWKNPNLLTLTDYNVDITEKSFDNITNYGGTPVLLVVTSDAGAYSVKFSVFVQDQLKGERVYDLHKFKYCRLSAWCDYVRFELKTKILINHNYSLNENNE